MRHTGTKESVLALFEENRGTYFSGEEIAAAAVRIPRGCVEGGEDFAGRGL